MLGINREERIRAASRTTPQVAVIPLHRSVVPPVSHFDKNECENPKRLENVRTDEPRDRDTIYRQAMSSTKREANGKVVEMVLKPLQANA